VTMGGAQSLSVAPVAEGEGGAGRRVFEQLTDRTYRVDLRAVGGPVDRRVEGGPILTCAQQCVILRVRPGVQAGCHGSEPKRDVVRSLQGRRRRVGQHAVRRGMTVAHALTWVRAHTAPRANPKSPLGGRGRRSSRRPDPPPGREARQPTERTRLCPARRHEMAPSERAEPTFLVC